MKNILLSVILSMSVLFLVGCNQEAEVTIQYDVFLYIVSTSYVLDEESSAPEDFHELQTWLILNTDAELLEIWRRTSESRITDFLLTYTTFSRPQITAVFDTINEEGNGLLALVEGDESLLLFIERL